MIKRLYVHNFRCLENFELNLRDRPSALLIGKNGSGKSTIAAALEVFLKIGRGITNRVGELVKLEDFTLGRSDVPMRFEIEAVINKKSYGYTLAFERAEGSGELRVFEEKLTADSQPVYSRDLSKVRRAIVSKDGMIQFGTATFDVNWHVVALPVIQEPSATDPLYIFRDWLNHMLILSPTPSQMSGVSTSDSISPTRDCANFGEWISGLLALYPAAYGSIEEYLKQLMPDFMDFTNLGIGRARSLTVQFQKEEESIGLSFDNLSDGEKCFFLAAVVIAANQAYGPLFCFWDEPENYLAPSEIADLVMTLRRSFKSRGQLLVTSHNPEAIRQFSNENTLVLGRRSHLEPTILRPLSDINVNGDLIGALIRDELEL